MSENKSKLSKLTQSSKSTSSKKRRNKRNMFSTLPHSEFPAATSTFSGLAVALLLGLFGVANTYADSSITISLSGAVNLNLMGGNSEGVFGKSSSATASVETNNYTGYTFTITGNNNTGVLVGANDQNHTIPSITTPLTESTFNTSTYNNKWGFLPSKINSITNTEYQPSPTLASSTTIDVTKSANTGDPNSYTLAVAARVDDNTPNDHYSGGFTLAATSNPTPYHIAYTDDVQNMPSMTVGETTGATVSISSQKPYKNGYIFLGWCSVPTSGSTCSGATYQPGDSYTLDTTTDNSTTLHAIWTKGYDTFEDAFVGAGKTDSDKTSGYFRMQDITPAICNSIITGSPTTTANIAKNTLIDTRNNKTYLVAKYADGHCWMRENLNLPLTANTDVVAYDFSTGNTFNYKPAYTTQTTAGTTWAENGNDGARSYGGDKDKYIGGTDSTVIASMVNSGQSYEKIGIYYNWSAATAQNGSQAAAATGEVTTSICPKGWRLPSYSGDYSFSVLMGSYGLPTTNQSQSYSGHLQNPLNFNRPGDYNHSSGNVTGNRGANGNFWTSAGLSTTRAGRLNFSGGSLNPQYNAVKGYGYSIRCVAV